MSKRLRMLVALATVAAMMLSLAGIASAQFDDVDKDASYADDVELLYDLGITTGISETEFGPDQALTRQQFAVFVIRAQKQAGLADSFANWRTSFSDDASIAPWARGAVYLATSSGIINGYPDGTFRPNNPVTTAEALTMLVRALGFKTYAESKGGFPAGYLIAAQELGLDDGLTLADANLPMQRWEMAVALVNALNASRAKNDDGSPKEDATTSWLAALWNEEPTFAFEGKVGTIRTSSQRIDVGNRTFKYNAETVVSLNDVAQYDDPTANPPDPVTVAEAIARDLIKKDTLVSVTYDDDNTAIEINILVDTYKNAALTKVKTDDGETEFGTITVGGRTLEVDDETVVLLDGKKVDLADLEEAFEDFQDEWGKSPAVASVRVEGKDDPTTVNNNDRAIYVSVITDDIVEGKIERAGRDRNGEYVVIDGERYTTENVHTGTVPGTGKEVALLLGHDGKAYVVLQSASTPDSYYAILSDYVRGSEDEAVLELGDGTEVSIFEDDFNNWNIVAADAGSVVFVNEATSTVSVVNVDPGGDEDAEDTVDRITSRAIRLDNGDSYIFAESVIVYDYDEDEYVDVDDIEDGDNVRIYLDTEGDVGLIVIDNP